jgi:hypothetical protein
MRVSSLPSWAIWWIAAAALLSPVLAFLMAIAVEIVLGALMDAGMLEIGALIAVGTIGWFQIRKLRFRPGRRAPIET